MNAYAEGFSDNLAESIMGLDQLHDAAADQEALEDMARVEAESFAPIFREYLLNFEDWRGGSATESLRCVFAPIAAGWSERVQIQRSAVLRDWIAYRTSTARRVA